MNENNENKKIEENDNTEEIKTEEEPVESESSDEIDNVTREINLDDLYDGAINNTVVIDPITNDEVFLPSKKPNYTIIGVVIAIIILLVLYYVNNKTSFGIQTKNVVPKTTEKRTTNNMVLNGTLTCTYSSKSDAESQSVTYVANYKNSSITDSKFNFVVVSNNNESSAIIDDLKSQYETFYINNAAVKGQKNTFDKSNNGFTFNSETTYSVDSFDDIIINENQTILYVRPNKDDTYQNVKVSYEQKGFTCNNSN